MVHDGKKAYSVAFSDETFEYPQKKDITLISTGTTGSDVERTTGLSCTKVALIAPKEGDAQITAHVPGGKIQIVIFFRDPINKYPPRGRCEYTHAIVQREQCTVSD
ncbi:MAG: hypothetical protein ACMUEM_03730 [Flavobacteriales bacterium AspAUS03]